MLRSESFDSEERDIFVDDLNVDQKITKLLCSEYEKQLKQNQILR